LSPKRKNKPDKLQNDPTHGYFPIFSPDFKADLAWWYRHEPKKGDKILDLVADRGLG
jgi:toxin YoeB